MRVETKFTIGDTAYLLRDNAVHVMHITQIKTFTHVDKPAGLKSTPRPKGADLLIKTVVLCGGDVAKIFDAEGSGKYQEYDEAKLFATKEELLNSL